MSCEDLFTALGQIRDAINNQQLSISLAGVESRLQGIETAISNQQLNLDTSGVESRLQGIETAIENQQISVDTAGIETKLNALQSIADRIDDLGGDLGLVRDEITGLSQNISLTLSDPQGNFIATLTGIKTELFNIDEVAERMLVYEGTKTDFFGQTMTTQAQELRNIAQQILDKNLSVVVNIPLGIGPSEDISIPSEGGILPSDDDACWAAVGYYEMQGSGLEVLSEFWSGAAQWPTGAADYAVNVIRTLLLSYFTKEPFTALEQSLDWWKSFITESNLPNWQQITLEYVQKRDQIICAYYNFVQDHDDGVLFDFYDNELSDTLASILKFSDLTTFAIYAFLDYQGDSSAFWQNFNRYRLNAEDQYSSGYCNDCGGGGGGGE